MSRLVEERVVSMQFNNQNFEKNVQQSLSTIDKLKSKLNFTASTKALDNLGSSMKKVDTSGLASGIDTLTTKFNMLDIIGVTALVNIANSAVNAGKRMVQALTVTPVLSGLQEYETQINAIQTILANTQSKGSTLEDVNKALDELNKYADLTIYNFTEMTRNIGTFTAAGVDLETSVSSIKGIANLAAVSGSTSAQASTAMYQLSQAIAAGKVQLMDWNSVVHAGMGGELFQNALKRTATHFGYNVDAMIEKYGSFRESLTQGGWLTTEVLTETLTQLSGAYNEADLIAQGYTAQQAKEITQLAETAVSAATEVKTFTQMWDALKESAQSGWTQTWEIIIGDFNEAKELWTNIFNVLSGIINAGSEARNVMLEGALGSKWDAFSAQVQNAGIRVEDFTKKLTETAAESGISIDSLVEKYGSLDKAFQSGELSTDLVITTLRRISDSVKATGVQTEDLTGKLDYFQDVVDRVWNSDFKNAPERYQALAEAGYDYAYVQDLVNKTVDGHKLTLEDLNVTQLEAIGYTEEEIIAIKDLADEAEKAGTPLNKLINNLKLRSGRDMLLEAFSNIFQPISSTLKAINTAWTETFGTFTGETLYKVIEAFLNFSKYLKISEDNVTNLTRVFKGLFAVVDIFTSVFTSGFKVVYTLVTTVLKTLWTELGLGGSTILEYAAIIGDSLVALRDWIKEHNLITKSIEAVVPIIVKLTLAFGELLKTLWASEEVQKSIEAFFKTLKNIGDIIKQDFSGAVDIIKDFFDTISKSGKIKNFDDFATEFGKLIDNLYYYFKDADFVAIGENIIDGLIEGLRTGFNIVVTYVGGLSEALITKAKEVLGIHSPSTVFFDLGTNVVEGLANGIASGAGGVFNALKDVANKMLDTFKEMDLGHFFVIGTIASILVIVFKLTNAIDNLIKSVSEFSGFSGLKSLSKSVLGVVDSVKGVFKSISGFFDGKKQAALLEARSQAFYTIAKSIAILAASLYILSKINKEDLTNAGIMLAALMGGMYLLLRAMSKIQDFTGFGKTSVVFISLGISMLLLSAALKIIAGIDIMNGIKAVAALVILMFGIIKLIEVYGKTVSGPAAKNMKQMGKMLRKLATSLLIMAVVIKILGSMDQGQMQQGLQVVIMLEIFFMAIIAVYGKLMTGEGGRYASKAGSMLKKMAVAMLIMVAVVKLFSMMSITEIVKGVAVVGWIMIMFGAMVAVSYFAGEHASKAGTMLLKMSVAFLIMCAVIDILANLSVWEIAKAKSLLLQISGLFAVFILLSAYAGDNASKAGSMLLKMSFAFLIMAAVIKIISMFSMGDIAKGLLVIFLVETLFAEMIAVSYFAGEHASKAGSMLLKMSVAMLILVASIAILSMLDYTDIAVGTAAIYAILQAMSSMIAASSVSSDSSKTIQALAISIGILAAALVILASMDVANVLAAGGALTAVILAFSYLVKSSDITTKANVTLILLAALVGFLAFVLSQIADLPVDSTLANATGLSMLILAMSASIRILGDAKTVSTDALIGMAALTGVILGLSIILALFQGMPVDSTLATAAALSLLLLAMSASLEILDGVKKVSTSALISMGVLTAVVGLLGGILYLLQGMDVQSTIVTAIALSTLLLALSVCTLILAGVGLAGASAYIGVGALITLIGSMGGLMAAIGALVTYVPDLETFINKAIPILEDIGHGLGSFIGNFVGGLIGGMSSGLPEIGDNLSKFMENMEGFIEGSKNIDPSILKGFKALAQAILILTAADIMDAIGSFITGGTSISDFAKELSGLGKGMREFHDEVNGIDTEAVKNAAEAAKILAEMADTIPNEGGLAATFAGENGLDVFASYLPGFGENLSKFSTSIEGINIENIKAAAEAGKALADMANAIGNEGGLAAVFTGENSLDVFASYLPGFGENLSKFSTSIEGINIENIKAAAEASKELAVFADETPDNTQNLASFGANLTLFGGNLKSFFDKVMGVTAEDVTNLSNTIDSVKKIQNVDSAKLNSVAEAINNVAGSINNLANHKNLNSEGIVSNLSNVAKNGATAFVKGFDGMDDKLNKIGATAITKFISGSKSKESEAGKAAKAIAAGCKEAIRSAYKDFKEAGKYLVEGFANGISANIYLAKAKARAMAAAAAIAAKEQLDEHSPSRVGYEIGDFFGVGFVNGISDNIKRAYEVGSDIADSAKNALTNSVGKISDLIDTNIDSQPTIRPVLDLSDVNSGVDAMNSMFGMSPSVGMMNRINGLSISMNRRNQNGNNDDVVAAIKDLKKSVDNMPGDQYNIDGVSQGEDVGEAIKTIVRHARVERRK